MSGHMTDDIDWRPADGWYTARCSCGWSDGPFPDLETMADALMDHAASAALADRPAVDSVGLRGAADAVLDELDIIRRDHEALAPHGLVVHVDTHEALRAALSAAGGRS